MYSIITKLSKVALTSTMCTSVHMSIHRVMGVSVRSMCMPWFVYMQRWNLFLSKHRFQPCMVHDIMAQSGAQTIHIEEEGHAIGELESEATLAWQTWESISIFKFLFSFRQTSKSFEIKSILFFKESFSFTTKSSYEDITLFFFKTSLLSFLFFKISFSFRASSSLDFNESLSLEISTFSCKTILRGR